MSEETKEVWEQITEDGKFADEKFEDEEEAPEFSESEQRAMDKGWRPQSEWNGNPDEWRTAKEYLDRSSFFEKIEHQKREIQQLRQDVHDAKEHMQKLREVQNKDIVGRLEKDKLAALEEGDYNSVVNIDKRIREAEIYSNNDISAVNTTSPPQTDPLFEEWLQDNNWYNTDPQLRTFADASGISYRQNNPNATPQEVYSHVTELTKRAYADKFNPRKADPQTTSPSHVSQPTKKKTGSGYTPSDLDDNQKRVGQRFVKLGLFKNLQEYVDILNNKYRKSLNYKSAYEVALEHGIIRKNLNAD